MNDLQDLRDSELERVDMSGSRFTMVRFNGVDVTPLVEAELDRIHPERPTFRPTPGRAQRGAVPPPDRRA